MFSQWSVCLCPKYLQKLQTDCDKIFGGVGRGPRNNRNNFGGDPDCDPNPGIFKGFHIFYYRYSYKEPRIKHVGTWRKYALCRMISSYNIYVSK